jgi:drug/metabolite transporter (DMT)-like permease
LASLRWFRWRSPSYPASCPSSLQVLGMATALVGVVLVSARKHSDSDATRGAMLLAAATAVAVGLAMCGTDRLAEHDPYWAVLIVRASTQALFVAAYLRRGVAGRGFGPRGLLALTVLGGIDISAMVLWAVASREGMLSVVSVLGGAFPAVTVLLSLALLGERRSPHQAVAVVGVIGGCAVIAT